MFMVSQDNTVAINSKHVRYISISQKDVHNYEVVAEITPSTEPITLGYAVSEAEAKKILQTFITGLTLM